MTTDVMRAASAPADCSDRLRVRRANMALVLVFAMFIGLSSGRS